MAITYQPRTEIVEVTVASGTTTGVIDLKGLVLGSIEIPASLGATSVEIRGASTPDGAALPLYDSAGDLRQITGLAATAGRYEVSDAILFDLRFVELVFGSSLTDKTIRLHCRGV